MEFIQELHEYSVGYVNHVWKESFGRPCLPGT